MFGSLLSPESPSSGHLVIEFNEFNKIIFVGGRQRHLSQVPKGKLY